jgi:hypothetical protein
VNSFKTSGVTLTTVTGTSNSNTLNMAKVGSKMTE